jgi:hypothetical protein
VRCGAGEKVKKKKEQRPTRGSHTSAREEKEKGSGCWDAWLRGFMGLLGCDCCSGWAGGLVLRRNRPELVVRALQIILNIVLNTTQINSK